MPKNIRKPCPRGQKLKKRIIEYYVKSQGPPTGLLREIAEAKILNDKVCKRIRITTLNIKSFWAKHEALECYINDQEVNIAVPTEANVVLQSVDKVNLPNFKCVNHCCRSKLNIKGGGGGVLIFVHNTIPCLPGYNKESRVEGELEHCSATLYLSYEFTPPINLTGIY